MAEEKKSTVLSFRFTKTEYEDVSVEIPVGFLPIIVKRELEDRYRNKSKVPADILAKDIEQFVDTRLSQLNHPYLVELVSALDLFTDDQLLHTPEECLRISDEFAGKIAEGLRKYLEEYGRDIVHQRREELMNVRRRGKK